MKLTEGLDYHSMKGQVEPRITIDEYSSKMGKDSDFVTLTFTVNSKLGARDLVSWLEIGYNYIRDASVSDGEIEPGKWLVFVEMKRKSNIVNHIVSLLEDLETITDIDLKEYTVSVEGEDYDADVDVLNQVIITSPNEYKKADGNDEELNEMREIAGIKHKKVFDVDEELRDYISKAGL